MIFFYRLVTHLRMISTRNSDKRSLIFDEAPGVDHLEITGCRLPTYKQVLLCYISNLEKARAEDTSKKCKLKHLVAKVVVEKVLVHYKKAGIKTKQEQTMLANIRSLHDEFLRLQKAYHVPSVTKYKAKLGLTMPFWPNNILNIMEAKIADVNTSAEDKANLSEDKLFMESMMSDRKSSYSQLDKSNKDRIIRRKQKLVNKKPKTEESTAPGTSSQFIVDYETPKSTNDSSSDSDWSPVITHKRKVKVGGTLKLNPNFLSSPAMVSSAVRNQVSITSVNRLMKTAIEEGGGDVNAFNLSYSQTFKQSSTVIEKSANKIKESWSPPSKVSVHWDGKIMAALDGSSNQERLPILVSGSGEAKLLGATIFKKERTTPTGDTISKCAIYLLDSWGCKSNVIAMVFDTTAVNTGHISAACTAF